MKRYLAITFRNLLRNKIYTLINILGLTVGTTLAILIFLLVSHELSYDKFHQNKDRIYRVVHTTESASGLAYSANIPYPAGYDLNESIKSVELFTEIHQDDNRIIEINEKKQYFKIICLSY